MLEDTVLLQLAVVWLDGKAEYIAVGSVVGMRHIVERPAEVLAVLVAAESSDLS